jgi:hypothetical protein
MALPANVFTGFSHDVFGAESLRMFFTRTMAGFALDVLEFRGQFHINIAPVLIVTYDVASKTSRIFLFFLSLCPSGRFHRL